MIKKGILLGVIICIATAGFTYYVEKQKDITKVEGVKATALDAEKKIEHKKEDVKHEKEEVKHEEEATNEKQEVTKDQEAVKNKKVEKREETHIIFQSDQDIDGIKYTITRNDLVDIYIIACAMFKDFKSDKLMYSGNEINKKAKKFFEPYKNHEIFENFDFYMVDDDINHAILEHILRRDKNNYRIRRLIRFYEDTNAAEFFRANEEYYKEAEAAIKNNIRKYKVIELIEEVENCLDTKKTFYNENPVEYETVISVFRERDRQECIVKEKGKWIFKSFQSAPYLMESSNEFINKNLVEENIYGVIHMYIDFRVRVSTKNMCNEKEKYQSRITLNKEYRNLPIYDQIGEYIARAINIKVYDEVFNDEIEVKENLFKYIEQERFNMLGEVYALLEKYEDEDKNIADYIDEVIEALIRMPESQRDKKQEDLNINKAKDIIWRLEGEQYFSGNEGGRILGKKDYGVYGYYTYAKWNGFNTVDEALEEHGDYCTKPALKYIIKKDLYDIFNGKIGYHGSNEMWTMIDKENSRVRFKVDEEDYKEVEVEIFLEGYCQKEIGDSRWDYTAVYTFNLVDDKWKVVCVDGYGRADHLDSYNNKTYVGEFAEITSSSELLEDNSDYGPELVDDSSRDTSWVEGAEGDGIGEWIYFKSDKKMAIRGMDIANGYFKNDKILKWNNRVKKIEIQFDNGKSKVFELKDLEYEPYYYSWPRAYQFQTLDFGEVVRTKNIKVIILDVYKGEKFSDTCISEIKFIEEKK